MPAYALFIAGLSGALFMYAACVPSVAGAAVVAAVMMGVFACFIAETTT